MRLIFAPFSPGLTTRAELGAKSSRAVTRPDIHPRRTGRIQPSARPRGREIENDRTIGVLCSDIMAQSRALCMSIRRRPTAVAIWPITRQPSDERTPIVRKERAYARKIGGNVIAHRLASESASVTKRRCARSSRTKRRRWYQPDGPHRRSLPKIDVNASQTTHLPIPEHTLTWPKTQRTSSSGC